MTRPDCFSEGAAMKDLLHNETVKEAFTFEEMRAEIFRLRFHDAMVRQVMDMADMRGLSAEERYVVLSYYALRERSKLKAIILEDVMYRPASCIVTPNYASERPAACGRSARLESSATQRTEKDK